MKKILELKTIFWQKTAQNVKFGKLCISEFIGNYFLCLLCKTFHHVW